MLGGTTARALLVAAAVLLLAARLLHTADQKTLTADEPHYIGTALYLWESGDYHYVRSLRFHPPLAFHLAGLPLLALDLSGHEITPTLGGELIRGADPPPERVRLLSRLPFIALTCWGAVLIFSWAREAAGFSAGLLALFLFSFSPTILANGALAHSDITVCVLYLQTLYALWRWSQVPSMGRLLLCGVSLGLALLAKLSALLLVPTLAVLLAAWAFGLLPNAHVGVDVRGGGFLPNTARAVVPMSAILAVAVGVVWAGYGGSFAMVEGVTGRFAGRVLPGYVQSLFFDVAANAHGRPIFLFGEVSKDGRWYFLPAAFLLKTPVPVLALLAVTPFLGRGIRNGIAPFIAVPVIVYGLIVCFWLRVPLGLRYVLPLIPLIHLFVATRLGPLQGMMQRAFVASCCLWLAAASLWIHPHYLAYFNELAGGPKHAHRHMVESNLDWGQDLRTLASFLQSHGNPEVWLAYFGPEKPERYGIRAKLLRGCEPVTGWVAISASVLRRLYSPINPFRQPPEGCYDWLLEREPVAQPGYSILVYDIPKS